APVVLASAPAPAKEPAVGTPQTDDSGVSASALTPSALLHEASLKTETREVPARTVVALPLTTAKSTDKLPATSAKPALAKSAEKPGLAAAQPGRPAAKPAQAAAKKSVAKAPVVTAQAVTRPVRIAKVDPLAPLPAKHYRGLTAER